MRLQGSAPTAASVLLFSLARAHEPLCTRVECSETKPRSCHVSASATNIILVDRSIVVISSVRQRDRSEHPEGCSAEHTLQRSTIQQQERVYWRL